MSSVSDYFKRNLKPIVGIILDSVESSIDQITEEEFLRHYNMGASTVVINGDVVTETTSTAVATTTKAVVEGNDTFITLLVPASGAYNYMRTTTITESEGVETLTTLYQRIPKQGE